jgi:CheY-like chemotaxis protein
VTSSESIPGLARVLVVEDEPLLLQSVVTGLSRLPGVEVVGASSVGAALVEIQARAPAIVISDIDLPDRSGIELLGELGARGLKPHVVFVSAYVKAYRAQIPPHAGVEVLEKPVSLEQLRQVVNQWLGQPVSSSSPFGVADYLQLASLGKHSVMLDIGGAVTGRITVVEGQAWAASDLQGEGMAAFRRLALAREVLVQCQTLMGEPGSRSLSGSCESLLLECARLADEAEHGRQTDDSFTELSLEEQPSAPPRPPPVTAKTFEELFERAVEVSLTKQYALALEVFRQAAQLRPEDPKVKVNILRLQKILQGPDKA